MGKKEINKKAKAPLIGRLAPLELQQSRRGIQEMADNQLTLLKMGHFLNMWMRKKKFFFLVVDLMRTAISTNSGGMFALITFIDLKINGTTTWMLPCISASVNMAFKGNVMVSACKAQQAKTLFLVSFISWGYLAFCKLLLLTSGKKTSIIHF